MSSIIKVDTVQDIDGNNIINENANTITIGASGDTITIPSGATLANNGTATGFASIAWQSITTAATLTTVAGKGYPINTTSNACTVTLPSSASVGDQVQIVDYAGTFATNNITLTSTLKIEGGTDDKVLTTNREGVIITYVDATQGWVATTGVNSGNQAIDPIQYSADFLVIAGGGSGGGRDQGAGGGAGGYRSSNATYGSSGGGGSAESSLTFLRGTVYTITVGAGGASAIGSATNNGINSSISGTGITTITSTYGGGGGANDGTGNAGGSGGGGAGASANAGGVGTSSQGYAGGTAASSGAAGGGGASAVGANGSSNQGGNGGAGKASTITGSSVTRAGGGGGYGDSLGTGGAGGGGNGGLGGNNDATGGSVNTGSGGGGVAGSYPPNTSGAGGSGVVILRMPTANYSSTTTGSPTVSTDGTDTILIYNGDGSYTA